MGLRQITYACLIGITLSITASASLATDEAQLTEQETRAAQQAARRFVKRMQQTRDVSLLFDELFLPDFISHFVSDDESMPKSQYSRLTKKERLRLFTIHFNTVYLTTLDVLSKPEKRYVEGEREKTAFESIFPAPMARELRSTLWRKDGEARFGSHQNFQSELAEIEKLLAKARAYLIKRGLEQTPDLQRKLDDTVKGTGINYRVRAYVGGDNIKDCEPLIGFPTNQKFFRVETPLFMGVVLIKDDNQMKIVRLTYVDGD
jgi:hypothetical protein